MTLTGAGLSCKNPTAPTGVFFDEATPESLALAIERFEKNEARFDPDRIRRWAGHFSPSRFDLAFDREIEAVMESGA